MMKKTCSVVPDFDCSVLQKPATSEYVEYVVNGCLIVIYRAAELDYGRLILRLCCFEWEHSDKRWKNGARYATHTGKRASATARRRVVYKHRLTDVLSPTAYRQHHAASVSQCFN